MTEKADIPTLKSMDDIHQRAREINSIGEPYRVAVAAAHDEAVMEAVVAAHREGIANGLLFGHAARINPMIEQFGGKVGDFRVINTNNDEESATKVAESAGRGEASLIMKGILPTSRLLKSVLNEKYGLRRRGLLSHTAVLSPERYHKLLAVTDGGMVIKPTFDQKVEIIRNAVLVSRSLGIDVPKVAILSMVDQVVNSFNETFEAAALSKMGQRGQIQSCDIDGPMSFDTAVWHKSFEYQGMASSVAGHADIVVAGSIEQGNILAKSLTIFGGAAFGGVIIGANVPISLVSRADDAINKMTSIALAVVVAHYLKTR